MGDRFKALIEGVLMASLDSRYTQVGFNFISVQVCWPTTYKHVLVGLKYDNDTEGCGRVRSADTPRVVRNNSSDTLFFFHLHCGITEAKTSVCDDKNCYNNQCGMTNFTFVVNCARGHP